MGRTFFVDESVQGSFLGVGGYIVENAAIVEVERAWATLKETVFGADPYSDFKWNMQPTHAARRAAEARGFSGRERARVIADFLHRQPIKIIVNVLWDMRTVRASGGPTTRTPVDLYRRALSGLLDRWINELAHSAAARLPGPNLLVLDFPPVPSDYPSDVRFSYLARREMVAFDLYREVYRDGLKYGTVTLPPLKDLRGHSSPLLGHASANLALQIADCVVGIVTGMVRANVSWAAAHPGDPLPNQVEDTSLPDLLHRCRTVSGKTWRFGVLLFPKVLETDVVGAKIDAMSLAAAAAETGCSRH